ncbi:hypothetical protein BDY24DRAFT_375283 [Mrakia frigida]|uniref:zinc finger MYND domain-containing protein n=1 Tax=Mrakia frigida TaxID=29902 RepID=UPI003FCBEE70
MSSSSALLETSAAALGFDEQESWKKIAGGEATRAQCQRWNDWCEGRSPLSRGKQVALSYQIASQYMPTIALAFQKEISTYFIKPVLRPPPTETDHIYTSLFYQVYCSSYYAKWMRSGGEDVKDYFSFMWRYICQMTVEDLDLSDISGKLSTHLEIFTQAILYSSHPLPPQVNFLPSNPSTDPSVLAVRQFLGGTLDSVNSPQKDDANPFVGLRVQKIAPNLLKWLEAGGREPMNAQFDIELWELCAGGCLNDCEADPKKGAKLSACTRCRSVSYCSPEHQRRHWIGKDLSGANPFQALCFPHKTLCFQTTY